LKATGIQGEPQNPLFPNSANRLLRSPSARLPESDAFASILSEILKEPPSNVFFYASQRLKEIGDERLLGVHSTQCSFASLGLMRRRTASAHADSHGGHQRRAAVAERGDSVHQRCAARLRLPVQRVLVLTAAKETAAPAPASEELPGMAILPVAITQLCSAACRSGQLQRQRSEAHREDPGLALQREKEVRRFLAPLAPVLKVCLRV
jgi:hypothetical protein